MSPKIAAVTVLYNPDKNFTDNVLTYAGHVSLQVIVDNREDPDPRIYESLQHNENIKFIINHQNNGIAKALNEGTRLAMQHGCDWVLTMDQDSCFEKSMIEKYLENFHRLQGKETIAVIGPVFENEINTGAPGKVKEVTSLITSGSLINTTVFNEIGGYNENLFIDEVDHEYCYRAKLKGYSVLQFQDIFLQHQLGRSVHVTTITGKKNKNKTLHSPTRLYYIVRNSCYVIAMYKKSFPLEMKIKRKDVLVRIKNNFLYGDKKMAVIKYAILGYLDYKRNRFGKY